MDLEKLIYYLYGYRVLVEGATAHCSPWDWGQIGTKLGTEHAIYQKLANFMWKKDIYVNRLESVTFGM